MNDKFLWNNVWTMYSYINLKCWRLHCFIVASKNSFLNCNSSTWRTIQNSIYIYRFRNIFWPRARQIAKVRIYFVILAPSNGFCYRQRQTESASSICSPLFAFIRSKPFFTGSCWLYHLPYCRAALVFAVRCTMSVRVFAPLSLRHDVFELPASMLVTLIIIIIIIQTVVT